jgi:(2Fe-2S) ferredoxin
MARKAGEKLTMTPTNENVSWDRSGNITIDDTPVVRIDSEGEAAEWYEEVDEAELKAVVVAIIAESNEEIDYIDKDVRAWSQSITYR